MSLGSSRTKKDTWRSAPPILTESYSEKPVTVTMIEKKMDRPERIRELRRQGLSVSDICEQVGVTRQTVWRHSKAIEPVEPAPTPTPTPDGNGHAPLDLEAAQSVGLGVLVQRAQAGSVSAAAHVFKATSAEIRANRCPGSHPEG